MMSLRRRLPHRLRCPLRCPSCLLTSLSLVYLPRLLVIFHFLRSIIELLKVLPRVPELALGLADPALARPLASPRLAVLTPAELMQAGLARAGLAWAGLTWVVPVQAVLELAKQRSRSELQLLHHPCLTRTGS